MGRDIGFDRISAPKQHGDRQREHGQSANGDRRPRKRHPMQAGQQPHHQSDEKRSERLGQQPTAVGQRTAYREHQRKRQDRQALDDQQPRQHRHPVGPAIGSDDVRPRPTLLLGPSIFLRVQQTLARSLNWPRSRKRSVRESTRRLVQLVVDDLPRHVRLVLEHQHLRMVVDREAFVREPEAQSERGRRFGESSRLRQAGTLICRVHELDSQQLRVGGELLNELVSQFAGEELPVVLASDRITFLKSRDRPVQAVAEKHEIVASGQLRGDVLQFAGCVGLVELQLPNLIVLHARKPLLPMLLQHDRTLWGICVDPSRSGDRGVGLAIQTKIGNRVESGRREHGRQSQANHGAHRALHGRPVRQPDSVPQICGQPRREQQQKRGDRDHISKEFDLKRACDEEIRRYPRQQQHVESGVASPERQRDDQRDDG